MKLLPFEDVVRCVATDTPPADNVERTRFLSSMSAMFLAWYQLAIARAKEGITQQLEAMDSALLVVAPIYAMLEEHPELYEELRRHLQTKQDAYTPSSAEAAVMSSACVLMLHELLDRAHQLQDGPEKEFANTELGKLQFIYEKAVRVEVSALSPKPRGTSYDA